MMSRCLAAFFLLVTHAALACDVPVFRYALERWAGDPFQLVVFSSGALPADLDAALQATQSEPEPQSQKVVPNWQLTRVDTSKPVIKLWAGLWASAQKSAPAPTSVMAALCTPEWRVGDEALWLGELTAESLAKLAHSPKREEVVKHLLSGKSAVWLLLESGDKAKDQALASIVATESERLYNTLPEPRGVKFDGINVLSPLPVTIDFATVRVAANDPAEAMLVRLLTNGEPVTEPMLCPLFGRGRVLALLAGSKVNKGLMEETAMFLTGACSCQVKAQNPGFDLLLKANWNAIFTDAAAAVPPPTEANSSAPAKPIYIPLPKKRPAKP